MPLKKSECKPKIIYIMGCARSGSTILGFILGNGEECLDLGEVSDFILRKGVPNGFGEETENGKFWKAVREGVSQEIVDLFGSKVSKTNRELEYHRDFPLLLFGLAPRKWIRDYSTFINSLYINIFGNSVSNRYFVDSSKYPGRALLLSLLSENADVFIVHLVRNPIGVINAMSDKRKQQGGKSFFEANLYYFVISLFCFLVKCKVNKGNYIKVRYEDISKNHTSTLKEISRKTGLNLSSAINMIENNQPLARGSIFNGNRLRVNDKICVWKKEETYKMNLRNRLTYALNGFWY